MKVIVKGKGEIELTKKDFLASGGEGEIYRRGKTVFKIYLHAQRTIPLSKLEELSEIEEENVIAPKELVYSLRNEPIGYTMRYLPDTYALCQLFTRAFKDRNNISPQTILDLILQMQNTINHIHNKNILIVDLNEMNFLLDKTFENIFFIDVDSYQTKNFPATAIMDSIRDRHTNTFSTLTDWFSFGILSFQMFIGIHPYKGKHPKLKTLDERMRANVPVFNKQVSYPKICFPFDIIPQAYREWYKAILAEGKRLPPPSTVQTVIIVPVLVHTIQSNESFDIKELYSYDSNVDNYISFEGIRIATTTQKEIYVNSEPKVKREFSDIGISSKYHRIFCAGIKKIKADESRLRIVDVVNNEELSCDIAASAIMSYDGRLYIKNIDKFLEVNFIETPTKTIISSVIVTNVLENATKIYDGVVIQNVLGSCVCSIFPESRLCYQIIINELKGYQLIEAKYDKKILIIIANKNGKYDKFILKISDNFASYELRKIEDIIYSGINFVVLNNGIVIHITEEEKMEIFSNKIGKNDIKIIEDNVRGSMRLFSDENKVLFSEDNKIYRIGIKK